MTGTQYTTEALFGTDPHVRIELGAPIQLDIKGVEGRLQSTVVGILPGQFLIVTRPKTNARLQNQLYRGNVVVIHYVFDGDLIAFRSRLLATRSEPGKLLFLGCPKVVIERSLRADRRINCRLPARLSVNGQECPAVVLDLSMAGAHCVLRTVESEAAVASKGAVVSLDLQLPGQSTAVHLAGKVRAAPHEGESGELGIEFDDPGPAVSRALRQYLDAVDY